MAFMEWSDQFDTGMEHKDKNNRLSFMIINRLHATVAVEEDDEAAGKYQIWVLERRTPGFLDLRLSERLD